VKNLIIVGARGMARDVLQIAKDVNHIKPKWHIKGCIADWGQDIKTLTNAELDTIGSIKEWRPEENEEFVCAISDPVGREKVVKELRGRGAKFINLIHPTVTLNDFCEIGEGNVIYPFVFVGANTKLGNYVVIHPTVIGHDVNIGDFTFVGGGCGILGEVYLGKRVYIGYNVVIVPGKKINDDAYVGAGSVVIRNVAEGTKVFGNPARRGEF